MHFTVLTGGASTRQSRAALAVARDMYDALILQRFACAAESVHTLCLLTKAHVMSAMNPTSDYSVLPTPACFSEGLCRHGFGAKSVRKRTQQSAKATCADATADAAKPERTTSD